MNLCFYLGYWLKMAFFHGMLKFFKRGAKLRPSEHRVMFDESSGQRSAKRLRTSNSFLILQPSVKSVLQGFFLKIFSWNLDVHYLLQAGFKFPTPRQRRQSKWVAWKNQWVAWKRGGGHEGCWGLKLVGALWTTCLYN